MTVAGTMSASDAFVPGERAIRSPRWGRAQWCAGVRRRAAAVSRFDELAGSDLETTLVRASIHCIPQWRFEDGKDPFDAGEQRWQRLVTG